MLVAVCLVAALAAQRASAAVFCNGSDSRQCDSALQDHKKCTRTLSDPECTRACGNVRFNFLVDCLQCWAELEYAQLPPAEITWRDDPTAPYTGNSYYYDQAATVVSSLYRNCRNGAGLPADTKNVSEPPLPVPLPPALVDRPRTCAWACDSINDPRAHKNDSYDLEWCLGININGHPQNNGCVRANSVICKQAVIDSRAACYQCRFSSASTTPHNSGGDWANDTSSQERARRNLDEMVQACSALGHKLTNPPLYAQWPLPTDPALGISVTPTTTTMLLAASLITALAAARVSAVNCTGADGDLCWSLFSDRIQCTSTFNEPGNNCSTVCEAANFNLLVECRQCVVDDLYARPRPSPGVPSDPLDPPSVYSGDSYAYDVNAGIVRAQYQVCRDTVGVPPGAANISEPPLPGDAPLPPSYVGRPRTCVWVCDRADSAGRNDSTAIDECFSLNSPLEKKEVSCAKLNGEVCNQGAFDDRAACYQCRLSQASSAGGTAWRSADWPSINWENNTYHQDKARRELDDMVQACSALGHQLTNTPLYTQWPLPTDPALGISVSPTTTFVAPTGVPGHDSTRMTVATQTAVAAVAAARDPHPSCETPLAYLLSNVHLSNARALHHLLHNAEFLIPLKDNCRPTLLHNYPVSLCSLVKPFAVDTRHITHLSFAVVCHVPGVATPRVVAAAIVSDRIGDGEFDFLDGAAAAAAALIPPATSPRGAVFGATEHPYASALTIKHDACRLSAALGLEVVVSNGRRHVLANSDFVGASFGVTCTGEPVGPVAGTGAAGAVEERGMGLWRTLAMQTHGRLLDRGRVSAETGWRESTSVVVGDWRRHDEGQGRVCML
ncbi:hypothetical protein Q8F55_001715 [Vanrija albida]|uniref:Uncharacterized protein n=1 Tax=Vanrija albida TaxID=181172 RepID=A0ABR3Q7Y1_9TREE